MPRSIIYAQRAGGSSEPATYAGSGDDRIADGYTDRLVKYIPTEVVTLYLFLDSILKSSGVQGSILGWVVLAICLSGTYFYLRVYLGVVSKVHQAISVFAFLVWAFALGGPFQHLAWYQPIYGALLLPIYTFCVGVVSREKW